MALSRIDNTTTKLCGIAYKYGVDKCPQIKHTYTPFYYELLKDKQESFKKVLEMGIGYPALMEHVERIRGFYRKGASLYMWRDFFPNAEVYGADIDPDLTFADERITTFVCDQTNKSALSKLIQNTGTDIDLFIDDGSHQLSDQIFTCQNLMTRFKRDVIYIIEDVKFPELIAEALSGYNVLIPNLSKRYRDNNLVVVRNESTTGLRHVVSSCSRAAESSFVGMATSPCRRQGVLRSNNK